MNHTSAGSFARLIYQYVDPQSGVATSMPRNLLTDPVVFLGTDDDCQIALQGAEIAPYHAAIYADGRSLMVRDLKQGKPLLLNGHPTGLSSLLNGDRISVGAYEFIVETDFAQRSHDADTIDPGELTNDPEFSGAPSGAATIVHHARDEEIDASNRLGASALLSDGSILPFQAEWLSRGQMTPTRVHDWEMTDVLGVGGMGWIYRANVVDSGEAVAIKLISRTQPPDFLSRLELEAAAGLKLDHPNIIKTIQHFETEDSVGLALGYVEGISLDELVHASGPISTGLAVHFARQIVSALSHMHEHGIIHRDLKPGNLMVDLTGNVTLLDLGLALIEDGDDTDEFSLAMIFGHDRIGTPDYMAPEQSNNSFRVDERADLYSLGCTLFYLLTGEAPFSINATSADEIFAAHHQVPVPWHLLEAKSDCSAMRSLLEQLLGKNPDDRIASADAVLKMIDDTFDAETNESVSTVEFDVAAVHASRKQHARDRLIMMRNQQMSAVANESNAAAGSDWFLHPDAHQAPHAVGGPEEFTSVSLMPPSEQFPASIPPLNASDPELAELSSNWSNLPSQVRESILSMARNSEADDDDFELST